MNFNSVVGIYLDVLLLQLGSKTWSASQRSIMEQFTWPVEGRYDGQETAPDHPLPIKAERIRPNAPVFSITWSRDWGSPY